MRNWLGRIGWFTLIWVGSVATLAIVAYGIRLVIFAG